MTDVFDSTKTGEKDSSALTELVGEGKKFTTNEELAKGKLESDAFIEQLQGENEQVRKQLADKESNDDKTATVAELIKAVREQSIQEGSPEGTPSLSEEELGKKIKTIMQGETDAQTRATNREQANQSVLDKVNGDKDAAVVYLTERAKQLNMTVAGLTELGEVSPEAFTKLMDTVPPSGPQSIAALPNQGQPVVTETSVDGHHTKAYYTALKKELGPQRYWNSSRIQGQYYKDALALGDRFEPSK